MDFPKFGWILIGGCAIWFAMSGSEVRIPALLRVGQWLIPVLLVMTGIEAIWTAFHRRLYVPGGVGRVMKRIGGFAIGQRWQIIGVLLLLLAACLIALVLRRFAVGRRRLQVGAVLLVPLAGLFSTLVIWDGLQSSYWSVARQNLWPVFGESACGSGETAGYVDPALARDLTESGHEREIPVALPDSLQPLDLMGRFPASVPATELRTMLVGDDAKHALFAHAPSVVEVPLDQIVDGRLHFGYGIVGDEPYGEDPSDGVTFLIVAERESGDSDVLYRDTLDPSTDASHPDWKHGWADLTHADDPIRGLSLVTEEVGNENYDWSAWTSLSFLSADRQQLVGDMRADAAAPGTPLPSGKVYGSLVAGSGAAEVGWFTTPWYEVPAGTTSLFVEVAGQLSPEGNSLFVQTLVQGDDGTRVLKERRLEQRVDDPRWRLTAVDIPPGTTETRLIGIDQSRDVNGWLGVGTPAAFPAAVTVQDSVARGATPVLMNPYIRPWFPCLEQAPLAGGRAQAPGLQIKNGLNDASSPVRFADDVYTYYTSGANRPIRRVLAPGFDDVPWSASPIWD